MTSRLHAINDWRYLICPETLDRIWIPPELQIIRVGFHPQTDEPILFPRHQYQNTIPLQRTPDSRGARSVDPCAQDTVMMDIPTRLELRVPSPDRRSRKRLKQAVG